MGNTTIKGSKKTVYNESGKCQKNIVGACGDAVNWLYRPIYKARFLSILRSAKHTVTSYQHAGKYLLFGNSSYIFGGENKMTLFFGGFKYVMD